MLKSKAVIFNDTPVAVSFSPDFAVPDGKKWNIQQVRFYMFPSRLMYLDVFVNNILRLTMFCTPYSGIFNINDTIFSGDKVNFSFRSQEPAVQFYGAYIQYDELDI